MLYRKSKLEDKDKIEELLSLRFGKRPNALKRLEDRYYLCFDGETLVAMTGLCKHQEDTIYNGYEIDWTCVRPGYEGLGIISSMVKFVVDLESKDIYCSCWKWDKNAKVNLHSAMEACGFEKVIDSKIHHSAKHCRDCKEVCIRYTPDCECWEDLYLRKVTV